MNSNKLKIIIIVIILAVVAAIATLAVYSKKMGQKKAAESQKQSQTKLGTDANIKSALPATVSTKPGSTADEEIKNIGKDLEVISDDDFGDADLSDRELGL